MLQAAGRGIIAPMEEPPEAKILILARQQASARRWAEMLQGPGTEVWLSPNEIPDVWNSRASTRADCKSIIPAPSLLAAENLR